MCVGYILPLYSFIPGLDVAMYMVIVASQHLQVRSIFAGRSGCAERFVYKQIVREEKEMATLEYFRHAGQGGTARGRPGSFPLEGALAAASAPYSLTQPRHILSAALPCNRLPRMCSRFSLPSAKCSLSSIFLG